MLEPFSNVAVENDIRCMSCFLCRRKFAGNQSGFCTGKMLCFGRIMRDT